jgi:hypothetical protein
LVTSTLIEGVNTSARNVLIVDNKIANKKYDYFTFSNIRGRSGRMNKHFIGRVVVFNPEPQRADLTVDVPVLSQPTQVSDQILLQIPENELTAESRARLQPYLEQSLVNIDTLRANKANHPDRQMRAATTMAQDPEQWASALTWQGSYPTASQVRQLGSLLFALTGSGSAVRSDAQLGARVNMLRSQRGNLRALAEQQIERGSDVDDAVEDALDFAKNWAQFRIPTAVAALGALANDVLGRDGRLVSDTRVFAGALDNMFLPPFATVLEEYGLPVSLALRLDAQLRLASASSLDDVLARLRALTEPPSFLGPFEREMLADTLRGL